MTNTLTPTKHLWKYRGGGRMCMQSKKNNLTGKNIYHQNKLIQNFLANWKFQFAVFQKLFPIFWEKKFPILELWSLTSHPHVCSTVIEWSFLVILKVSHFNIYSSHDIETCEILSSKAPKTQKKKKKIGGELPVVSGVYIFQSTYSKSILVIILRCQLILYDQRFIRYG